MGWLLGECRDDPVAEQFNSTMRTGVDPNGYHLSENMPWKALAHG